MNKRRGIHHSLTRIRHLTTSQFRSKDVNQKHSLVERRNFDTTIASDNNQLRLFLLVPKCFSVLARGFGSWWRPATCCWGGAPCMLNPPNWLPQRRPLDLRPHGNFRCCQVSLFCRGMYQKLDHRREGLCAHNPARMMPRVQGTRGLHLKLRALECRLL